MTIESLKSITDRYSFTEKSMNHVMNDGTVLKYNEVYSMWLKVN